MFDFNLARTVFLFKVEARETSLEAEPITYNISVCIFDKTSLTSIFLVKSLLLIDLRVSLKFVILFLLINYSVWFIFELRMGL